MHAAGRRSRNLRPLQQMLSVSRAPCQSEEAFSARNSAAHEERVDVRAGDKRRNQVKLVISKMWQHCKCNSGFRLPKVCCPTAAIPTSNTSTTEQPPTTTAPTTTTTHAFSSHANLVNLADIGNCGKSSIQKRIVGGQNASLGEFPWLANLGYEVSGKTGVHFKCGAALIGERYVVTAAHCVTNLPGSIKLVRVRVGEHVLSQEKDCELGVCSPTPQDFNPELVIPHKSYNSPNAFQNDIALIKLDRNIVRNGINRNNYPKTSCTNNFVF